MTLDDLISSLFQDVASPSRRPVNGPGEMVRQTLSGNMPGMDSGRPAGGQLAGPAMAGAKPPAMPSVVPPEPPNMASPAPAPQPVASPAPRFTPNPLSTFARGYQSGGLFGAFGNLSEEPEQLRLAEQKAGQERATAQATANQTVQALISKGVAPDVARAATGNPALMKQLIETTFRPPADDKPMVVNNKLINPATGDVIGDYGDAPTKKPPTVQSFFDEKSGQEYKAQWNEQDGRWDRVGGNERSKSSDLKEYQTKDAMFAERLMRTNAEIDKVMGFDPASKSYSGYDPTRATNNWAPDTGMVASLVNSAEWKQYQRSAREGIAAILRKDTGAAVTEAEWELYWPMLYPQPGDDTETVNQKRNAREAAMQALKGSSGPAFDQMFPNGPIGSTGAAVRIQGDEDYDKLQSGARFIGPDGKERVKP
jgi:hypothetical protein